MMVAMMPNKSLIALFVVAIFVVTVCEAKLSPQEKLNRLRNEMAAKNYQAVIIPSDDEHLSEYPPSHELRREWISGFTGSAGTAVITATKAALWTDSRYWNQAERELELSLWTLMKQGEDGVPSLNDWITQELKAGDKVGMSAKFVSIGIWESREKAYKAKDIILENTDPDLIDLIWPNDEREPKPNSEIKVHALNFAGKTWEEKVAIVQERMVEEGTDLLIVSALDEVAWLLNLRAKDIPYNPMVISYAIISRPGGEHRFYIEESRIDQPLRDHLKDFVLKPYSSVFADITELSQEGKRIWVPSKSSYAIYQAIVNKDNIVMKTSPVQLIKARKSQVEIENTRRCHIRDSAARVRHLSWLDTQLEQSRPVTEQTSARMLEAIQAEDSNFVMPSFEPISAVGANAAIVHYSTDVGGDNLPLSTDKIYLLDAGAQYLDCTTDITRTHHFGRPTQKERDAYTRVMQGSIDLASIVFPSGVYGRELDVQARQWLWRSGLDFGHGTGHGIGYYLSVHEYPPGISVGSGGSDGEFLDKGMVESDEPGYYETGSFGIRLETDLEVVEADVPNHFQNKTYFKFETLTFVPFDRNLIDECVLTNSQVDWLNKYNKQIQEKVRPLLKTAAERGYLDLITQDFKYTYTIPYCSRYSPDSNDDDQGNSAQIVVLSKPLMAVLSILYIAYTRL